MPAINNYKRVTFFFALKENYEDLSEIKRREGSGGEKNKIAEKEKRKKYRE